MFYQILILLVSMSAFLFGVGCAPAAIGSQSDDAATIVPAATLIPTDTGATVRIVTAEMPRMATVVISDGVSSPPLKDIKTRTPAPPVTGGGVVTMENASGGVTLHVGEKFLLALGAPGWIVQVGDESIVARVDDPNAPQGSQGYYKALKSGNTAIAATSDPPCAKAKPPCMMPTLFLEIPVNVLP